MIPPAAAGDGHLTPAYLEAKVREALVEDGGQPFSDPTSRRVVPAGLWAEAELRARAPGVVAGLFLVTSVYRQLDGAVEVAALVEEGAAVAAEQPLARLRGPLRCLLSGERVALNFVQRLSGVASLTRRFVTAVEGTRAVILDTRKTTPGLRPLERHAVRAGGGRNHRYNLAGGVLVKDNHVAAAGGVGAAVRRALAAGGEGRLEVEVEVEDLGQLTEALAAGAELVLLDNMTPEGAAEAVRLAAGRARLEVSGGVSLAAVRAYAEAGVDSISVGALTHSAPALDVTLEVVRTWTAAGGPESGRAAAEEVSRR